MTLNETLQTPSLRKRLFKEALDSIEYKVAAVEDARDLALLFQTAFGESHYKDRGIVYSLERAWTWLADVIETGRTPHVIAVRKGKLIGAASYALDSTFCEAPVAVLDMAYVLAPYRRSAIGRVLIALVTDMAKGDGACAFHAPIASGMVEQATLINLFRHAGFEQIGVIMGRRL